MDVLEVPEGLSVVLHVVLVASVVWERYEGGASLETLVLSLSFCLCPCPSLAQTACIASYHVSFRPLTISFHPIIFHLI